MKDLNELQAWREKRRNLENELYDAMDRLVAAEDPAEREVIKQEEDRLAGLIAEAQRAMEALWSRRLVS